MEYNSGAVSPVGSISEGWNIIKDNYWLFFGMTLVAIVIVVFAAVILGFINNLITMGIAAAFGVAAQSGSDAVNATAAIVPQLISTVISFFTNIIVITISGALFVGIYSAMSRQADTRTAEFGDLFNGFQKLVPCLIVAVIMSIIQFVISVVFLIGGAAIGISALGAGILTRDGQLNPAIFGSLFLIIMVVAVIYLIINLIVSALTAFIYPLLADRNLSGGEAFLMSVKGGVSNIFGMILLFILLFFMSLGGVMLCVVGVLFVAPVMTASIFAAFRSVFGRPQDNRQHTPPAPPVFGQQPGY